MPQTTLALRGRESISFELFDQAEVAPNLYFLVRAQHDRLLESGRKLWEELAQQPLGGPRRRTFPQHRRLPGRPRWAALGEPEIAPPRGSRKLAPDSTAVMARKLNPPGVGPSNGSC
jgi:hypothetical protein